ncbi:chaperone protein dnaJ 11, chloroplastic-like [Vigna unguiculata]|uniref:Curved DNA-binding protein n=1 Tax=Vigna unguiculata TaxID=3917 RepID=A0A4D6KYE3_VIGUN|nr:chaperone protein dnaJ 11, chloroplastic-like [Vigna unguiculata]QCD82069.1 curved DNA-binding protein [Vigna unguiculata]QCD82070.1 curved DNA-binding protein [Vigna unguiculata]
MASCTTLYQILGICPAASEGEIKAAYRQLVKVCHPDVAPMGKKESSGSEFIKIHDAYRTLLNPDKRAKYDRNLIPRGRVFSTASSGVSGYNGRRWETDQCW